MELLRSLLFVPGNRPNMLERARQVETDVIMADLEDSVPPSEKENARALVRQMAPGLCQKGQKLMVRLNSLDTGLTRDELAAVIGPHLYGFSLGKVESTWDIGEADRITTDLEQRAGLPQGQVRIIPWIETASAVLSARDIARASSRVVALAFGAEDYTNDMGVQRTDTGEEVLYPRAHTAVAARAAGIAALDSVYVRYRDDAGLRQDIEAGLRLGYRGKFAIHPAQVSTINEMFSPSPDDIDYARRVVEVWRQAEAQGRGSTSLDGRMVDVPVVKRAQYLLALADAIATRSSKS